MSYEQIHRIMARGLPAVSLLPDQRSTLHSASRLLPVAETGAKASDADQGIYGHVIERRKGCPAHAFCLGTDAACEAEIDKVKQSHKGEWA